MEPTAAAGGLEQQTQLVGGEEAAAGMQYGGAEYGGQCDQEMAAGHQFTVHWIIVCVFTGIT